MAVLDANGRIATTFSASDCKGLTPSTLFEMESKVSAVLSGVRAQVTCFAGDSVRSVLRSLVEQRVRRVYVVDKTTSRPSGVITLTDACKVIYDLSKGAE